MTNCTIRDAISVPTSFQSEEASIRQAGQHKYLIPRNQHKLILLKLKCLIMGYLRYKIEIILMSHLTCTNRNNNCVCV